MLAVWPDFDQRTENHKRCYLFVFETPKKVLSRPLDVALFQTRDDGWRILEESDLPHRDVFCPGRNSIVDIIPRSTLGVPRSTPIAWEIGRCVGAITRGGYFI